jgi:peroxiredoxin
MSSPLYRDLMTAKVETGEPAFDFELPRLDDSGSVRLSDFAGEQPVVLIFGSYT